MTLEEMASVEFEPIELGKRPMKDVIAQHGNMIILAFGVLTKSKEELIAAWSDGGPGEEVVNFVKDLIATQAWLEDTKKLLKTAEMRLMCAAAAAEIQEAA